MFSEAFLPKVTALQTESTSMMECESAAVDFEVLMKTHDCQYERNKQDESENEDDMYLERSKPRGGLSQ